MGDRPSRQSPSRDQRAQHPGIDRQRIVSARTRHPPGRPTAAPGSACGRASRSSFCGADDTRLVPVPVMDAPEMLGAALGAAPVREGNAVDLPLALRKHAGDDGGGAVDRGERIAHLDLAHRLPADRRLDAGVQRLRLPHRGPPATMIKFPRMQPGSHLVQVHEPGRKAGDGRGILVQLVDALHHLAEQRATSCEGPGACARRIRRSPGSWSRPRPAAASPPCPWGE